MDEIIVNFFRGYAQHSAMGRWDAVAALYADDFVVGGPSGCRSVCRGELLRAIPVRAAQVRAAGSVQTTLSNVEEVRLGSDFTVATTRWVTSVRTATGVEELESCATYLLERRGDALQIVLQIDHQDLLGSVKALARDGGRSPRGKLRDGS